MNLIQRYIFKNITAATVITVFIITAMVWVTQALRYVGVITDKGQNLGKFIEITLLALPGIVNIVLPFAVLCGCIFVLNQMDKNREITAVMSGSGSKITILKPVIFAASLFFLISVVIMHVISPWSSKTMRNELIEVSANFINSIIKPGEFNSFAKDLTIHIGRRGNDNRFNDIFIEDNRQQQETLIYVADTGEIIKRIKPGDSSDVHIFFVLGNVTIIRRQKGVSSKSIHTIAFPKYEIDLSSLVDQSSSGVYKPYTKTSAALLQGNRYDPYLQKYPGSYSAEFHSRNSLPLYIYIFAVIGFISVVNNSGYDRGRRRTIAFITATIIALSLRLVAFGLKNMAEGVGDNDFLIGLMYAVPIAIFIALVIFITLSTRLRHRKLTWRMFA